MNATNITNNSAECSRAPRRALRVIVVEDEKDSLSTLVGLLQSEGHEVRGVGSAKALWSTMPNFEPDICLIDIGLPDRSGYDIAQEMVRRDADARAKLVAVTAWTPSSDPIPARIAGFHPPIANPYSPPALLPLVSAIGGALRARPSPPP